jgi:hypothetical protein
LKKSKRDGTMMGCSAEGETEGYIEIDGENTGINFFYKNIFQKTLIKKV